MSSQGTQRRAPASLAFLFGLGYGDGLADFTYLKAGKAPHRDVLSQFADFGRDQLRNRKRLVLNERLLVEANLFVEFAHLAFHDLFHYLGWFAGRGRLSPVDIFFPIISLGGYVLFANKFRITGGN